MWQSMLGLDAPPGPNDDIFSLGASSNALIEMLAEVERLYGVRPRIEVFFEDPTIAGLIDEIIAARDVAPSSQTSAGDPNPSSEPAAPLPPELEAKLAGVRESVQEILPLTPIQEGLLFHSRTGQAGDPYLMCSVLEFEEQADVRRYLTAFQDVMDRHDALRMSILWQGLSEPVQVVWRNAVLSVQEADVDGPDVVEGLLDLFPPRKFRMNLEEGPPIRIFIARDSLRDRWVMLQFTHHLTLDHDGARMLRTLIAAGLAGETDALPDPASYASHVNSVRNAVSHGKHAEFFQRMLGDFSAPNLLPGQTGSHAITAEVDEATCTLSETISSRLERQARRLEVTKASLLHVAWARLLGCLSSADDVVFGTVLSGRLHGGDLEHRALGVYVNTLPIRIDTRRGGLTECVRRTHAMLLDLLRHEQAPLALAQKASNVKPGMPLFGALLNVQEGRGRDDDMPQGCGRLLRFINQTNYPLVLDLDVSTAEIGVRIQSRGIMDAERLNTQFVLSLGRLIDALESETDTPLCALDIVSAEEREGLLAQAKGPEIPHDIDRCIHDVFDARAAETPDAVALVFRNRTLTYGALREKADRLADYLRALGVEREAPVGLCLERSLDTIVAMLAILKAGGAYVPLDPNYPKARLARMIEQAQARVIVTNAALRDALPEGTARLVCVDEESATIAQASAHISVPREYGGSSLACILFTSGSTGEPKGVCLEHRSVLRTVLDPEWVEIECADTFLQYASMSFDLAMVEIWGALLNGARLVICEPGQLSLMDLGRTIRDNGVTILCLSTALFHAMVDSEIRAMLRVTQFVVGGETLSRKHARVCFDLVRPKRLINIYGPTESTVLATCMPIMHVMPPKEVIPIGRPIGNTQAYILDASLNPVPAGVTGEIFIGGDGLARGYLVPELTAEKFIANPYSPGTRLYRTGDLARHRRDGQIEFIGRRDTQVKLRGYRIEFEEIEAVLAHHDGIEMVVVDTRKSSQGDPYLAAYVVPKKDAVADVASWRECARRELPAYMCPSAYVVMEQIPLSLNGKVKRGALPDPKLADPGDEPLEPPQGPTETALAEIWCEALDLPSVGRHQNFFDLGGHSILAAQIFSKVQTRLNLKASVLLIFRAPSIAELARELDLAPDETVGDYDPNADFAEILKDMTTILNTWKGERQGGTGLIVSKNTGGPRRGLFWSLQAEHELHELAKALGPEQPLYAMRSGHLIMDYTEESLPSLASLYANEVNQLQPEGAIVIGGNCQGAAVAYAAANRLIEMGREIALLIMLEQSHFRPFRGRLALVFGEDSHLNPYAAGSNPDARFRAIYGDNYTVDFLPGRHGSYFRSPGVDCLADVLKRRMEFMEVVS